MPLPFNRQLKVILGQEGVPGSQIGPPGWLYTENRIRFRVDMTTGGDPHKAKIEVWNPNRLTTAVLDGPLPFVQLWVAHGDVTLPAVPGIPRLIFAGKPSRDGVKIEKTGTDRVLTIDAKDGQYHYSRASVSFTSLAPVSYSAILAAACAQGLIPIGGIILAPDTIQTQGFAYSGSFRKLADQIAETTGSDWYIDNGLFYMVSRGVPRPGIAPVISSELGTLIGEPRKKDRGGIEVTALLTANMRPGMPFVVQAELPSTGPVPQLPGPPLTYVAKDVTMEGDNGWESPFYMTIRGKLPGVP